MTRWTTRNTSLSLPVVVAQPTAPTVAKVKSDEPKVDIRPGSRTAFILAKVRGDKPVPLDNVPAVGPDPKPQKLPMVRRYKATGAPKMAPPIERAKPKTQEIVFSKIADNELATEILKFLTKNKGQTGKMVAYALDVNPNQCGKLLPKMVKRGWLEKPNHVTFEITAPGLNALIERLDL